MNKKSIKSVLLAAILLSTFNCVSITRTETANNSANDAAAAEQSNASENSDSAEPFEANAEMAAQQSAAPDALVRDLYKTHGEDFKNNNERILNGKNRALLDKYFDKTLADYIWKDLTTQRDEVGVLDFDPFYNAQEADIKKLVVGQPKIEGDKASVAVTFQNYDRRENLNYQLARRGSVWKIADIKYTDGTSLLGYFREAEKNAQNSGGGKTGEEHFFAGTYRVGETTCTVKPIKMAFEVRWAKGSGAMIFVFDGEPSQNRWVYTSEPTDKGGTDKFVFSDGTFATGTFVRADGKEFPVTRVK